MIKTYIGIIAFGFGILAGVQLERFEQKYSSNAYVVSFINEFEGFKLDMHEDVWNGRIDSVPASYYLHNFEVILHDLKNDPSGYTSWYWETMDTDYGRKNKQYLCNKTMKKYLISSELSMNNFTNNIQPKRTEEETVFNQ